MSRWLLCLPLLAAACVAVDDTSDADQALTDPQAFAVLGFVNGPSATVDVLDHQVGLDARAARGIVARVAQSKLRTMDELDAVPYVGTSAIGKLLVYVQAHGGVPDLVVEGVPFTQAQAAGALAAANGATQTQLDVDAKLDSRAAVAIVAARPLVDLAHLANVSYVGTTALGHLRDYGAGWSMPCQPSIATTPDVNVAAWNDILEIGDSGDYGPDQVIALIATPCVDGSQLGDHARSIMQTQWAVPGADVSIGAPVAGGAGFVELVRTMRDALDNNGVPGWDHAEADRLEQGLTQTILATPARFVEVRLRTYAEECSETADAVLDLTTHAVLIAHTVPRC